MQRYIKVLPALETRKSVGKTTKVESTECAEGKVRMHRLSSVFYENGETSKT